MDNRVIVAGAGPVGLVQALALARQGLDVIVVGERAAQFQGRTVALFQRSLSFLDDLGVWEMLFAQAAPLRALRIIDGTDNLFRWRPLIFTAREIGLDAFGFNVEADILSAALRKRAESTKGIRLIEGRFDDPEFGHDKATIAVEGVGRLEAALIVAADGQRSRLRQKGKIAARLRTLQQWALTAILAHALPHGDVSTELHLRGGPLTLVPLRPSADREPLPNRSSLVWMLPHEEAQVLMGRDDEAFALAVERRAHAILGKMAVAGARGAAALVSLTVERLHARRLALVGEAAHAFPPVGAQGLNLGLRDAATLAELAGAALADGKDIGEFELLEAYDDARHGDVTTRAGVVAAMNRSLLSSFLPFDFARGFSMAALDLVAPLRRLVMREGVAPGFRVKEPQQGRL